MKAKFFFSTFLLLAFSFAEMGTARSDAIKPWSNIQDANQRFVVLSEFHNQAVLDRSTGLIWQQNPGPTLGPRANAPGLCNLRYVGTIVNGEDGVGGWRLPKVEELTSLGQQTASVSNGGGGSFEFWAAGHPFTLPSGAMFWSATSDPTDSSQGFAVSDGTVFEMAKTESHNVWCVHGGANGPFFPERSVLKDVV